MPFEPGKSGNPGGKSPEDSMSREIKRLAKAKCPDAIAKLAEWMDSDNPKASVAACNAILDRGVGKPQQSLIVDSFNRHTAELTDDELRDIAAGRSKRAIEAARSSEEPPELH